jgi:hypothetical protein
VKCPLLADSVEKVGCCRWAIGHLVVASVGSDTFTGVSAVAGSAFNDFITGSNNGANTSEEFAGRAGDDHIDGLGGFDRAFYNNDNAAVSGIHVDMALGAVTGDVAIGADTLRSVEAIRGTNFADSYDASNFGAAGCGGHPKLFSTDLIDLAERCDTTDPIKLYGRATAAKETKRDDPI